MTDREMVVLVRAVVADIDAGGFAQARAGAAVLRANGLVARAHEGVGFFGSHRMIVEWYAGQLINIVDQEAWFAMRSILAAVDLHAPLRLTAERVER